MSRSLCLALFGLMSLTPAVAGQSLFGSQGLGLPVEPLDARTRALGSSGLGLLGPSLSPVDIASAARIFLPSGQVSVQPHWVDSDLDGQSVSTKATRFPQLGLAYPVPALGGTALMYIGSFLDQRWEVRESSIQTFRGTEVPVTDRFKSDGGISTFQLGWAQRVGDELALGIGLGARIGSVGRTFSRIIDSGGAFQVAPFETRSEWQYSGLTASVGFQWDPVRAIRLGGAMQWSGEMDAEPTGDSEGAKATFDLPTEFRFGASGILTPRLAVTVGLTYADWQTSDGFPDSEGLSGSVMSYGGGLEWAGPVVGIRNFPIRLGFRRSDLPFTYEGVTPSENVFSGGIGLNLIPPGVGLVGSIDLAAERGTREAGALSETFWRGTVTFRVGSF